MSEHAYLMDGLDLKEPYHYTHCGLQDVYLMNGYEQKTIDGEECLTIHNIDDLHQTIGLFLVEKRKLIGPKELRFLRNQMDLTQAELGEMIGMSDQQIARWEKGESDIPGPADKLVRLIYLMDVKEGVNPRELFEELASMDSTNEGMTFTSEDDHWAASEPLVAA